MKRFKWCATLLLACVSLQAQTGDGPRFVDQVRAVTNNQQDVTALLDQLVEAGYVAETGDDTLRTKYVTLQGCIEQALTRLEAPAMGVIHTPMPATPLCTLPDPVDPGVLDPSIRDQAMITVQSRAQIVRDYLLAGGSLYVVYPLGGLQKRSPEQQAIYRSELANYPETLFDWPLSVDSMDPQMIGATYLFSGDDGLLWAFSIKSRQANDPQQQSEWAIWLGPVTWPQIQQRLETVTTYFSLVNGPSVLLD